MLELKAVSLSVGPRDSGRLLLSSVSANYAAGHFGAIIGPSGCGKTTLLRFLAGIASGEEHGQVFWKGRNLHHEDFKCSEFGYVPQFSVAHEELTVRECVAFSLKLRARRDGCHDTLAAVDRLLQEVDLAPLAEHRVKVLSGGQRRRLALAMELTNQPEVLLCDEVTTGLDPQAEDEVVCLLHSLSRANGRLVLSVTHSLQHLDFYDSVMVLHEGSVVYHGAPESLAGYFGVEHPGQIYGLLSRYPAADWVAKWAGREDLAGSVSHEACVAANDAHPESDADGPGVFRQFLALLHRRLIVFSRSRAELFLQAALIFGFPLLVAIFAWNGLPAVKNLSMGLGLDVARQFTEAQDFLVQASKIGSLVSGIAMFQVILLTLMGANNSGREIAAERAIFEKEKLSGLSPLAYVCSKVAFLSLLVIVQSLWMAIFVHSVCGFPGNFSVQVLLLLLVNAAMTAICLGVSSTLKSAEQASLASIYLVGFQLPLSGAVLALPPLLGTLTRPFISAYWAWSGILDSLRQERYYDIVLAVVQSPLAPAAVCIWVLCLHIVAGVLVAWIGCERQQLS